MIQTTLNEMQHITDVWNIRTFGFGICFVFRVSDLEFYGQARGDRAKDGFGLACPV